MLSPESREFIQEKEKSPEPPKEKEEFKYADNRRAIEEKKAELELKKLQIEIEKLAQPSTSVDYFQKMLELQAQHNNTLLKMQSENFDTRLEIEKLKLTDGGEDWVDKLLPHLPKILPLIASKLQPQTPPISPDISVPVQKAKKSGVGEEKKEKGGKKMKIKRLPNAKEIEEYKKLIKDGKIDEETAYNQAKQVIPNLTKEVFYHEFLKMKNG